MQTIISFIGVIVYFLKALEHWSVFRISVDLLSELQMAAYRPLYHMNPPPPNH
jgi:hypothetical protein